MGGHGEGTVVAEGPSATIPARDVHVNLGVDEWLRALDLGGERTAGILTIIATCIAHEINPRAYLHLVTSLLVRGWPNAKLRQLLPDRILAEHPEMYIGDRNAMPALPGE